VEIRQEAGAKEDLSSKGSYQGGFSIAVAIKVTTFFNGPNDHVPVINPGAFCPGAFCLLLYHSQTVKRESARLIDC
jgi:hypothetical protein